MGVCIYGRLWGKSRVFRPQPTSMVQPKPNNSKFFRNVHGYTRIIRLKRKRMFGERVKMTNDLTDSRDVRNGLAVKLAVTGTVY